MALKPMTLRLDEEEYEKLKEYLSKFGDPDINVAYVLRAYIRDLNRALPLLMNSDWDLKNYFGFIGLWLKQFVAMSDVDMLGKAMANPWAYWYASGSSRGRGAENASTAEEKEHRRPTQKKGGDNEE